MSNDDNIVDLLNNIISYEHSDEIIMEEKANDDLLKNELNKKTLLALLDNNLDIILSPKLKDKTHNFINKLDSLFFGLPHEYIKKILKYYTTNYKHTELMIPTFMAIITSKFHKNEINLFTIESENETIFDLHIFSSLSADSFKNYIHFISPVVWDYLFAHDYVSNNEFITKALTDEIDNENMLGILSLYLKYQKKIYNDNNDAMDDKYRKIYKYLIKMSDGLEDFDLNTIIKYDLLDYMDDSENLPKKMFETFELPESLKISKLIKIISSDILYNIILYSGRQKDYFEIFDHNGCLGDAQMSKIVRHFINSAENEFKQYVSMKKNDTLLEIIQAVDSKFLKKIFIYHVNQIELSLKYFNKNIKLVNDYDDYDDDTIIKILCDNVFVCHDVTKIICKICEYPGVLKVFSKCGHTLCTTCSKKIDESRCPFCKTHSKLINLYLD